LNRGVACSKKWSGVGKRDFQSAGDRLKKHGTVRGKVKKNEQQSPENPGSRVVIQTLCLSHVVDWVNWVTTREEQKQNQILLLAGVKDYINKLR